MEGGGEKRKKEKVSTSAGKEPKWAAETQTDAGSAERRNGEKDGEEWRGPATHHMQHVRRGTLAVPVPGAQGIVYTQPI